MMRRSTLVSLVAGLALGTAALPVLAHEASRRPAQADAVEAGAREPARVVDRFHAALTAGDVSTALTQLSDDAVVFESGGVERGKAEYAAHHARADAAFAKAVPSRLVRRAGHASGDMAWVLSEGRTSGSYKGKPVDRVTTETMVLRREGGTWRIVHVHWSSGTAKPKS